MTQAHSQNKIPSLPLMNSDGLLETAIMKTAELLKSVNYCIALTGAGISAESGIPTYRGKDGIWTKNGEPPLNQYERFLEDPTYYWKVQNTHRKDPDEFSSLIRNAVPNDGHFAMAELENIGILQHTITQNIDNLHNLAGSKHLTEIHGNSHYIRCIGCNDRLSSDEIPEGTPPRCELCGGLLKSDTVMFGEPIPKDTITTCFHETRKSDCILLVGTTAAVTPAADFAWDIYKRGHPLIEINPELTSISDYCVISIRSSAGEILPRIVDQIKRSTTIQNSHE